MLLTERLVLHAAALTASERTLAHELLQHYPDGLMDSASDIAQRTGTSASTVVRMFSKLGYDSLGEVRREARSQMTSLLQTAGQRATATIGAERSLIDCVEDAFLHDQHNLAATRQAMNMQVFTTMVKAISRCKGRVFVMAEKNSAPIAAHLSIHLNMCRPGVHDLGAGSPFAVDRLVWIEPQDLLLVFSIRRYSNGALLAAKHFRQQGATVLALTDSAAAPIVAHANHHLVASTSNASPFDSYTAAIFVCNALVSGVAQLLHKEVSQTLQRRDTLWKDFQPDTQDGLNR